MELDFSPALDRLRAMRSDLIASLPNVLVGVLVALLFYVLGLAFKRAIQRANARYGRSRNLGIVLGRLVQWVTILVGVLTAASVVLPGLQPADVVQLLGIGSVAIGFAFRDILENFLAGIILLTTEPFHIGDQIVFGSFEGTIIDIQTRATTITTYDGRRVVVPNATLLTNPITVNTAFERRRWQCELSIGYGDDLGLARQVIRSALDTVNGVLPAPPPEVIVVGFAESGVAMRVFWWVEPPTRANILAVQDRALAAIKLALADAGIDLPFPTRQILFHDQTDAADGDRSRQREGWPAGGKQAHPSRSIAGAILHLSNALGHRANHFGVDARPPDEVNSEGG